MPANVMIGLLSLLLAVILYTVGTWWAFRAQTFGRGQLVTLWLGAAFDVLATASMGMSIGGLDLSPTGWLHTTLALLVMAGMIGSTAVATYALLADKKNLMQTMSRFIVAPWVLWVAVFVWGLMTKMPRR
jgi:hypothetical protein